MTRSSPETELLPCPFCDGEPQQKHGYWIECKKCGAGVSAPKTNINTMGVIARWNTRAAPAGEPQAPLDRQKLIDLIGYRFGALVSGNNMPDMSGDPRARIGGTRRRRFDNACAECADAILALSRPQREMFKCNCPHEVRSGCSEPKCPHYYPQKALEA